MKKYYTIRITGTIRSSIWYANKIGHVYERVTLAASNYTSNGGKGIVVFEVNPCQWVYPEDCEIISEKIVKI